MYDKDFLGKNNFIWFNGVVEDRQDPQKLGRLRVRCVGIHTQNKDDLPTSDLPWSQLIHPITSSGISGLGSSPGFIVEGTWVFGYFRDGYAMQEPMIIGTLPGKPSELADTSKVSMTLTVYTRNIKMRWTLIGWRLMIALIHT